MPDGIQPNMLERSVLRDLNTLGPKADTIAVHLVAAGSLVDEDPQRALAHVRYARDQAPRIAAVREAAGIVAYQAGEWAEAARDLRACRRITGESTHLPIIADCERALGRADRAIELATSPEASGLPRPIQAELVIVHSGARRDLGEVDGALLLLERFGLDRAQLRPWSLRLWYAYADTLVDAGRVDEAREWFAAAAKVDHDGLTDAAERIEALNSPDGAHADDEPDDDQPDDDEPGEDER
ncbi:tetratricopeptide repeat protein [Cumulibacter soli]|uniref:tetratricopeptide repeat protein n=1 Tax=Cumulibacter soli TaxID=2546344 RepID=UPI0010684111|nr:tetratricopeptide repeat protein [Cumulibacter soli]